MVLDLSFKNTKTPKKGTLLIADPFMDEDYFRRSVVLLCDHNEESTFGFVLNNYLEVDLHELDENFPDIQARISFGGPVETQSLYYIHAFQEVTDCFEIRKGLYFGGEYDDLKQLLENTEEAQNKVRFFLGYSGWSEGQLEDELKTNAWMVADNLSNNDIFDTSNDHFWEFCLEKQGGKSRMISKFPLNPSNN